MTSVSALQLWPTALLFSGARVNIKLIDASDEGDQDSVRQAGGVCVDAMGLSGIDGTHALFCSTTFDLPNKTYPHLSFDARSVQFGWRPLCLTASDNDIKSPSSSHTATVSPPPSTQQPPTSTIRTHCHYIIATPSLRVPKPSWQGAQYKTLGSRVGLRWS
jgi:hypothetical protein